MNKILFLLSIILLTGCSKKEKYTFILQGQIENPVNNYINYAYDICGNDLPIFKELLTYDLSVAGVYYEYFYTYDASGNYASKTRTINVINT